MATIIAKWPENVAGKFYVDEQCIDCELCRDNAPGVFARNAAEGYSYVLHQPEGATEIKRCMAAMDVCPVGAIGYRN